MPTTSPIRDRHLEHEASFLPFGEGETAAEVVETFGPLELEYAAIRRGCALFDMPQRATIRVTGSDRIDFLNRMLTQELSGIAPMRSVPSFWLNRKGRIDADLRLIHTENETWFDLDTLSAERTIEGLSGFVFSEDVAFEDVTSTRHRLALAGPTANAALESLSAQTPSELGMCTATTIADAKVLIDRHDTCVDPTFDLHLDADDVRAVYEAIAGVDESYRVRPAGWHAYNIARIESGQPLYHLDFGPDSLPAETGVLRDRVNFKKGCYLGQEVVARMDALGHPKQTLCALRLPSAEHPGAEHQPMTGAPVYKAGDDPSDAKPIGGITSSTRSPMLGDDIICFAQIKWAQSSPGTQVQVMSGAGISQAKVAPALRLYAPKDTQPAG